MNSSRIFNHYSLILSILSLTMCEGKISKSQNDGRIQNDGIIANDSSTDSKNPSDSVIDKGPTSDITISDSHLDSTNPKDVNGTADSTIDSGGTQPQIPPNVSAYLEDVAIPSCDTNNSEHFVIQSNADWSHINDSDKRVFCVKPGDYSGAGTINLSADGTSTKPRILFLDNGNDTHPAKLASNQLAFLNFNFSGANYWIVDRMATQNTTSGNALDFNNNSTHNILNRFYLNNYYSGITLRTGSNYNTIQKSRLSEMTQQGRMDDHVAIMLMAVSGHNPVNVVGTKIVANEITNANDGIMIIRLVSSPVQDVDCPDTAIIGNQISIDSSIYTDCSGNLSTSGSCSYSENAIDLKGGTNDSNHPVVIAYNTFWGFRKSDTTGSKISSHGGAFTIHYETKNINIYHNTIFDCNRGFGMADPSVLSMSVGDTTISNNILYDIPTYSFVAWNAQNVTISKNIVKETPSAQWLSAQSDTNTSAECNVFINLKGASTGSVTLSKNSYYNTPVASGDTGSVSFSSATDAKHDDLTLTLHQYTNSPKTVTLPGVIPTTASPHACKVEF